MTPAPLPDGFGLVLDAGTQRHDGGCVLAGGRDGRMITLSPAGRAVLDQLLAAPGAAGRRASPGAGALARRLVDAGLAHPRPPAGTGRPEVTVVVPVRDRPQELDRILTALGRAHPVVVVDDGSADRAAVLAVCARHGAAVLVRAGSGGPAAARNTALEQVGTELVAFIDSDCVPPADWIDRLAPHFADPLLAAIAPRVAPRATDSGPPSWLARYTRVRSPLDLGEQPSAVGPGRPVAYVPTAALLVRRAALAGGFDPALRFGEDVDAVWRLHDAGWRVRYDPSVTVAHEEPAGWAALLRRRRQYGSSAAPLSVRHPGRLAPVVLRPWPVAILLALLAGRPRVAAGAGAFSVLRLARRLRHAGVPPSRAPRWSARATGRSAVAVSRAATMLAGPVLLLALACRPLRRPALALLLLSPLAEWVGRRPPLDPLRWTAACLADDAAYGAGVWAGALRERTLAPLTPDVRAGFRSPLSGLAG